MRLFNSADERARKAKLKVMEDKRVAFAQRLARGGFAPERMLFSQRENGGFIALGEFDGRHWLVIGPGFGADEVFVLEGCDRLDFRVEKVFVPAEGMGGAFGFGKKAESGLVYVITRADGSEARMSFVAGRNSWMEYTLSKNPLLKTQRRRGDSNLVWDFHPLDRSELSRALAIASRYFPADS